MAFSALADTGSAIQLFNPHADHATCGERLVGSLSYYIDGQIGLLNWKQQKGKYCNFRDDDECIRNQLIEKCVDISLKRKLLKKGEMNLYEVLETAKVYESDQQLFKTANTENFAQVGRC